MSIKKFIAVLTVILAGMAMSLSVYGATSLSIGEVTTTEDGYVKVPVYYNSTTYEGICAYNIQVYYDGSAFDKEDFQAVNKITYKTVEGSSPLGSIQYGSQYDENTDGSGKQFRIVVWASSVEASVDENGQLLLTNLYFMPNDSSASFSSKDFAVKITTLSQVNTSTGYAETISDSFATYVSYDIPKEVGEDWEYGYINAMYVEVLESGTENVLLEKTSLGSYVDNGDYYSFIVNLTNTKNKTKGTVDVRFYAEISDSDGSESTEEGSTEGETAAEVSGETEATSAVTTKEVLIETLSGVEVEYLLDPVDREDLSTSASEEE